MNRKNFLLLGAAFVLSIGALVSPANAVPVTPGAPAVPLAGTTSAVRPDLAGVVVADVVRPFSVNTGGGYFRGSVQDRVVRNYRTGTLDFYYRVYLDPSSTGSLTRVTRDGFFPGTILTDCDWRIDGLGQRAPHQVWRNDDGQWVYFDHSYGATIHPGEQSRFVFVKTNAKDFSVGTLWLGYTYSGSYHASFAVPGFQPE
jgi:hypothetical protein